MVGFNGEEAQASSFRHTSTIDVIAVLSNPQMVRMVWLKKITASPRRESKSVLGRWCAWAGPRPKPSVSVT